MSEPETIKEVPPPPPESPSPNLGSGEPDSYHPIAEEPVAAPAPSAEVAASPAAPDAEQTEAFEKAFQGILDDLLNLPFEVAAVSFADPDWKLKPEELGKLRNAAELEVKARAGSLEKLMGKYAPEIFLIVTLAIILKPRLLKPAPIVDTPNPARNPYE